jgi:ABC-type transport system involved in multi-copper enzyme maturation permease subunit
VIWVGWRQQRTETLVAAGFLALIALLLIPTGLDMASTYHRDGLSACLGQNISPSCDDAIQGFTSHFDQLGSLIAWFTLVPGLVGVLLAAPFVLEMESGTYRLAWTQSITRRRWIAGKLGLAIGAALLAALAFTVLITWWRIPLVHLEGRMDPSVFDSEGTAVFGYTLFALGLAAAVGVVWRRAVPALIVAFAGYFAARIFVDTWLRQRLVAPLTATWRRGAHAPTNLNHAWVMSEQNSDKLGHAVAPALGCLRGSGVLTKLRTKNCLVEHGPGYTHAVYQPASHFWALQGIETALFGGIALVLIAFAAWWTHQRAA